LVEGKVGVMMMMRVRIKEIGMMAGHLCENQKQHAIDVIIK
jgi:hypothetical protein